jgi:hypothetical protein
MKVAANITVMNTISLIITLIQSINKQYAYNPTNSPATNQPDNSCVCNRFIHSVNPSTLL